MIKTIATKMSNNNTYDQDDESFICNTLKEQPQPILPYNEVYNDNENNNDNNTPENRKENNHGEEQ